MNASGGWYVTPLVAELAGEHFQTAELLRHNGANPNVQCNAWNTPLHLAACYGDVEMVQVLLNLEADVNIRNNGGMSPFNYVPVGPVGPGEVPNYPQSLAHVARLLLDRGADIKARNEQGRTSLHSTAYMGPTEVTRVLLERGADVDAEDNRGRTPFSLANTPFSLTNKEGKTEIMK